ncbi:hypothetical protein BGX26_011446 [Mortierella sp. AD094]|nr:hypothetical protein BGX26_011446 [Mortierella sp. AD094]
MSTPTSGSVRFQDNSSQIERKNTASTSNSHRYLAPPIHPQTTSLLSAQESSTSSSSSRHNDNNNNSNDGYDSTLQGVDIDRGTARNDISNNSSSSRPKKISSSRGRGFKNSSPSQADATSSMSSSSTSNGTSTSVGLRPQRSLVMKHRLRKINDYYEEQQQLHQQQPVSKPLPPLPTSQIPVDGAGVGVWIPKRRGASTKNGSLGNKSRASQFGSRSNSEPSTEEMDTSGLLNYLPESDVNNPDTRPARAGTGLSSRTAAGRHDAFEMRPATASVDSNEGPEKASQQQDHDERFKYGHDYKCEYETAEERQRRKLAEKSHARAEHEQEIQQQSEGHGEGAGVAEGGVEPEVMLSKWVNALVFVLNLLAMTHLGKAAGACMEELVPKLGMSIVSVFDAMTSSSVELAVAAFALANGMVRVVQAAMLGAILNNLLLIMGISLCVGGYVNNQQTIQPDTSQTGMNLLMIVCISYVIPVALEYTLTDLRIATLPGTLNATALAQETETIKEIVHQDIWTISKIMAFILLILYGCCLLFQYNSRHFLVTPEAKHAEEHTVHKRHVHYWFAGWAYAVSLTAQIYSAKLLVHSVESLGKQFELNDSFVGFILLPIVLISDLQEEVIAIKESCADRLDRTIALLVGSCMQIALLVTPLLVLLGWAIGVRLTLRFTILEASILAGSVFIVNYLLQDNETNWLEGVMLLAAFFMCALAFYYDFIPFESEGGASESGGGGGEGGG